MFSPVKGFINNNAKRASCLRAISVFEISRGQYYVKFYLSHRDFFERVSFRVKEYLKKIAFFFGSFLRPRASFDAVLNQIDPFSGIRNDGMTVGWADKKAAQEYNALKDRVTCTTAMLLICI